MKKTIKQIEKINDVLGGVGIVISFNNLDIHNCVIKIETRELGIAEMIKTHIAIIKSDVLLNVNVEEINYGVGLLTVHIETSDDIKPHKMLKIINSVLLPAIIEMSETLLHINNLGVEGIYYTTTDTDGEIGVHIPVTDIAKERLPRAQTKLAGGEVTKNGYYKYISKYDTSVSKTIDNVFIYFGNGGTKDNEDGLLEQLINLSNEYEFIYTDPYSTTGGPRVVYNMDTISKYIETPPGRKKINDCFVSVAMVKQLELLYNSLKVLPKTSYIEIAARLLPKTFKYSK